MVKSPPITHFYLEFLEFSPTLQRVSSVFVFIRSTIGQPEQSRRRAALLLLLTLGLLVAIYWPTLLRQISGGVENSGVENPYMLDVGEIQVSLNIWGTVHYTGYPLYTMIGNVATTILRGLGINPAEAACIYAMAWGLVALSILYVLVYHLTGRAHIAAVVTLLAGLSRSIWTLSVIADERTMALSFMMLLIAIAMWRPVVTAAEGRNRTWLLALIGGFGIAHHRTVLFVAPGLLMAVWPGLRAQGRRMWITLGVAALIGLIGFLPYLYLPARALAHADWVYGNPGTLPGFVEQFTAREASFLIHLPPDLNGWASDFVDSFRLLLLEWTPLLAVAGALSLAWVALRSRFRREARIAAASIAGYFLFLFAFHTVVIPEADLLPIVMMFAFGIALALDAIFRILYPADRAGPVPTGRRDLAWVLSSVLAVILVVTLVGANRESVYTLTHDDTGLQEIARAQAVPRDGASVLMIPWGPHYTAIAYSKLISKENADLPLVSHSADLRALIEQGNVIYTERDTFYRFGLDWWDAQIGHAYLTSAGNSLVAIRQSPLTQDSAGAQPVGHGVVLHNASLCVTDTQYRLNIAWGAQSKPDAALSVFVKLLAGDSVLQPQGDSSAPVYGQYPTTRWTPGEVVYDTYEMPRLPGATDLTFGMYMQEPSGRFDNFGVTKIPLTGVFSCSGGLAASPGAAG